MFILKKGELNLPKLPEKQAKQLLAENLEQYLEFKDQEYSDNKGSKTERKKQDSSEDMR